MRVAVLAAAAMCLLAAAIPGRASAIPFSSGFTEYNAQAIVLYDSGGLGDLRDVLGEVFPASTSEGCQDAGIPSGSGCRTETLASNLNVPVVTEITAPSEQLHVSNFGQDATITFDPALGRVASSVSTPGLPDIFSTLEAATSISFEYQFEINDQTRFFQIGPASVSSIGEQFYKDATLRMLVLVPGVGIAMQLGLASSNPDGLTAAAKIGDLYNFAAPGTIATLQVQLQTVSLANARNFAAGSAVGEAFFTPIPEPSTAALLGAGLLGLALAARRGRSTPPRRWCR